MFCVTVTYANTPGCHFDFEYYKNQHLHMVKKLLGDNILRIEIRRGLSLLDGQPATYVCVASLWINSVESLKADLATNLEMIMADIPNYTNLSPVIQLDEIFSAS